MFKKIPVLFSVILLCLTLSFSSVFALDFEKLPAGVDVTVILTTILLFKQVKQITVLYTSLVLN
jgi:hypothetical protein